MLYTDRTFIKPIHKLDIPEIIKMYNEPDSFKYVKQYEGKSDEFYTTFLENKIAVNAKNLGFWSVRGKKNNEFIGTINLNQFSDTAMTHIGCHLKREFWNKGYATELLTELLNYAVTERKLKEVFGITDENNLVSKKLLKKLNFKEFEKRTILESKVVIYRYLNE
ncbi:GNAT family N-acetyltransferase [Brumimicrobium mesophilum]|uniref:GNAT family N-acetyltransferase n=1 Tax=Brumimicrobium mesophilum TaxID=392717 RepID=UPI000D1438E3|nr:GNAT family N-acetyltransferase [Brumimicrobium mesophilum]